MEYDAIVIGGGPTGVTAAIYLARSGKSVLLFEKTMIGGQVAYTYDVENYPGYIGGDGFGLSQNFVKQLDQTGVKVVYEEVINLELQDKIKIIFTNKGTYSARCVILCLGAGSKKLEVPNETELTGKGVSYCATCDGSLYRNKTVCVLGGGNSAVEEAIYLSDIAKKVYLVLRRDEFRAESSLVKTLLSKKEEGKDIEIIKNNVTEQIVGEDKVDALILKNVKDNSTQTINVDGIFVAIGRIPNTALLVDKVALDKQGYVIVNDKFETNIPGVFAGGDVIVKDLRQIVTAVSDGALISISANNYLRKID